METVNSLQIKQELKLGEELPHTTSFDLDIEMVENIKIEQTIIFI